MGAAGKGGGRLEAVYRCLCLRLEVPHLRGDLNGVVQLLSSDLPDHFCSSNKKPSSAGETTQELSV